MNTAVISGFVCCDHCHYGGVNVLHVRSVREVPREGPREGPVDSAVPNVEIKAVRNLLQNTNSCFSRIDKITCMNFF